MTERYPALRALPFAALAAFAPGAVLAQDTTAEDAAGAEAFTLAPVIVSGELLDREKQDSQTSAAIITGEEIEQRAEFDLYDVIERTPGVTSVFGEAGWSIRGISQLGPGGSDDATGLLVSTTIDGAEISSSPVLTKFGPYSTWDLEQVEVLRGPQSTQQGRNAMGGAIVVRSKDPVHEFEAKARGEIGFRDTLVGAAAINVPVVQDVVAVRLAADVGRTDGYISNPILGDEDFDERQQHTVRGSVLVEPSDDFSAVFKLSHASNFGGEDIVDVTRFPSQTVNLGDFKGREGSEFLTGSARLQYDFTDELSIHSESVYMDADYERLEDFDGTPFPAGFLFREAEVETIKEELKLTYDSDRVKGVFGIFYTDIDDNQPAGAVVSAAALNNLLPATSNIDIDLSTNTQTQNFAVFGEVEYRVLPELGLIAGGRYDRESIDQEINNGFSSDDPFVAFFLPASTVTKTSTTFDAFLPKAGIVYDWTPDLSTGFTVQRGYRAGGTSVNGLTGEVVEFDPEYTWNFEFAVRSQWLDGRLTANANVFYTDWSDQQVDVRGPSGNVLDSVTRNVGSSHLYGGELELSALPIDGLEVFASAAFVHTEFDEFDVNGTDLSGNEFPFAPEFTGAVGATYTFEEGFFVSADASFTGASFADATNAAGGKSDERFLVNTRAGYRGDNYEVFAYVRNLFDEAYVQQSIANNTTGLPVQARVGEPLTVGLVAQVYF